MAKRQTEKTVKHVIEVSDEELNLLLIGLQLIRNFGDVGDFDNAFLLISELTEED